MGVKIKAKYLWGFSKSACKIGRAKAAVLPEPVSANPIISLPEIIYNFMFLFNNYNFLF